MNSRGPTPVATREGRGEVAAASSAPAPHDFMNRRAPVSSMAPAAGDRRSVSSAAVAALPLPGAAANDARPAAAVWPPAAAATPPTTPL